MKVLSTILLLFLALAAWAQCSITSITFGDIVNCNVGTGLYVIPVTVRYTGAVGTLQVSATGLYYSLSNKKFSNPNQTSGINETTFVVYDYADGAQNNIAITASIFGGPCASTITLTQSHSWVAPTGCPNTVSSCLSYLNLTGAITTIQDYKVKDSIVSVQVIESSSTTHYGANNHYIKLLPGFHAKAGSNVIINLTGCN